MPIVHVPPQLRKLTGGERTVEVAGKTLGEVVDALEQRFPGIRQRLLEGEDLRPGLAAAVDSEICREGLRQPIAEKSEIHFIPAISGG